MAETSEGQTKLLQAFCEITTCDVATGRTILESTNWDLENAVSLYYEQQNVSTYEDNNFNVTGEVNANNIAGIQSGNLNEQHETCVDQGSERKRLDALRLRRCLKVFLSVCGTSLSAIFGFFKTLFCIPNLNNRVQDNVSIRNFNRPTISQVEQAQIEEARKIREEQDLEYMRSLNLDSMKQEKALEKKRSKDLIRERREKFRAELQQDREIEKESCSRVCVKNSAGKKFQRNFHKDDSVYEIFKWIDSLALDESNLISDKFSLRLPHSKSVEVDESYADNDITIFEVGFYPNTLLLIHNFDEDSDN
ncbi:UBX domain-containing [Cryptosporidium sp. chipmunk genotype I]|uniref:UBX domain-containing n=1 Tax=Cryptosporidium sp. chipmunk genotype I TaxID=1280935 RepID=UPI00351A53A4|nr:UBX domain-containing [Cryptosporidium sp. chipmunk genotype I]